MKKQVIVIGGGDTYETEEKFLEFLRNFEIDIERYKTGRDDWKPGLRQKLGPEYEVIIPAMPNKWNAQYEAWNIWFEKLFPFLNDEVILAGHSMGATFLAKYLSENKFPRKIEGVFLVSGVLENNFAPGESLLSFTPPEKLDLQSDKVFLYHSKDDQVVPFAELGKFQKALPDAKVRIFENLGHLNQEDFPELVEDIKTLS